MIILQRQDHDSGENRSYKTKITELQEENRKLKIQVE
jgi:hypothetical protein